ncbi:MAG TPA: hypothetical protein VIT45_15915, partial [Allosphingosinicella sp.]
LAADRFTFAPPAGARRIEEEDLVEEEMGDPLPPFRPTSGRMTRRPGTQTPHSMDRGRFRFPSRAGLPEPSGGSV